LVLTLCLSQKVERDGHEREEDLALCLRRSRKEGLWRDDCALRAVEVKASPEERRDENPKTK